MARTSPHRWWILPFFWGQAGPARSPLRAAGALLSAGALISVCGCASSLTERPRSVQAAASATIDPREALSRLAVEQATRPDRDAASAPPPDGVPQELAETLDAARVEKANMPLDRVLVLFPDPPPPPDKTAAEWDPEAGVDRARVEALRSYVVGRAQRLNGEAAAAEATLKEAARLDPQAANIWGELAEANLQLGNRSAAGSALRRALELGPNDVRALDLQSRLEMDRRAYDTAAGLLARLMRQRPEMFDPALPQVAGARLGKALIGLGYHRAGARAIELALDRTESFSDVTAYQSELGLLYRERGDLWRDAGDALLRIGDGASAADAYARAASLPNLNPSSLTSRRVFAAMRGGASAQAALLLLDQLEGSGGRIDQTTIGLVRHVASHSSVGPLMALGIEQLRDAMVPAPGAAARAALVRAAAASSDDARAALILRQHLLAQPADAQALRELMQRFPPQRMRERVSEVLALIEAAPNYEARFAQALLLGGTSLPEASAALAGHPGASSDAGRLLGARLRSLSGELEAAEQELMALASERPSYTPAVVARAVGLIRLGRPEDARTLLAQIDENASEDLRVAKALVLSELGEPSAALDVLRPLLDEAHASSPTRAERLLLAARLSVQIGSMEEAEAALRAVLEADPSRDEALAGLVQLYNRGGPLASDEKLIEIVRAVRDASPSSPTLRWLRAQEAVQRRQLDLAERDLLDLAEEAPDRPGVVESLTRVWITTDQRATAERWLRGAMERFPDVPVLVTELAGLLDEQQRSTEAISLLEARLTTRPGEDGVSRRLEAILRRDPQTRERADALAAARLARSPRSADAQIELAELALLRSDTDEAVSAIRRVLNAGRSLSPVLSARVSRVALDLSRRALSGESDTPLVLSLARDVIGATKASPELFIVSLRLMVRAREPVPALIKAAEEAGAAHASLRVMSYAAIIDDLSRTGPAGAGGSRAGEALLVVEHACKTLRPAPVQLQTFWISRVIDTDNGQNAEDLFHALTNVRQTQTIDEVLAELAKIFTRQGEPIAADELAYSIALALNQLSHAELIEWLYRQAIRLNPENLWANNNLGYRLLTLDREVEAAAEMVERAYKSAQKDAQGGPAASVTDSLGVARYKLGVLQDEKDAQGNVVREGAVSLLTRALQMSRGEPGSIDAVPIIADHLADALWAAGQREQAVELWTEALTRGNAILDRSKQRFADISPLALEELSTLVRTSQEKLEAVRSGARPPISKIHAQAPDDPAPAPPAPAPGADPAAPPAMIQ